MLIGFASTILYLYGEKNGEREAGYKNDLLWGNRSLERE
ncbi:hypothetical protein BMWSH_2010 [Priestia megaterium WSH-002]|uniref:Uncharacterized protein n=1 Tax=Priestia megaterium (strain WSH-002) TaxID=1006007 RepID=A0A8D3X0N3_PRIMW|nr:hypothetical protein BMWSH_2010 [Priestia megaterium WSH-002]